MSEPKSDSWRLVSAGSGDGIYCFADMLQFKQRHLAKVEALQRQFAKLNKASSPAS